MNCNHTIHSHQHHIGWGNSIDPVLSVTPGQTVQIETIESSGGQLASDSTIADRVRLDFGNVNPVMGSIYIEGTEPGDAVAIRFLHFDLSGWGWTANIPANRVEKPA